MSNKILTAEKFLAAIRELKELVDDDPLNVMRDSLKEDRICEICAELGDWRETSKNSFGSEGGAVYSGVDMEYIREFRDFENRYTGAVLQVQMVMSIKSTLNLVESADIDGIDGLKYAAQTFIDRMTKIKPEPANDLVKDPQYWPQVKESAQSLSENALEDLRLANSWLKERREAGAGAFGKKSYNLPNAGETGIDSLLSLLESAGVTLYDLYLGNFLKADILVPVHATHKHQNQERILLLRNISQANKCLLVVAPAGAVALMRSTLEHILVEYYGATGSDLSELIRSARSLPKSVSVNGLHALRLAANAILHLPNQGQTSSINSSMDGALEISAASFIGSIRLLIEGIPRFIKT